MLIAILNCCTKEELEEEEEEEVTPEEAVTPVEEGEAETYIRRTANADNMHYSRGGRGRQGKGHKEQDLARWQNVQSLRFASVRHCQANATILTR